MGDQQRWWKLWASAPGDDGVQKLSPAHRWAWAVFGIYTKVHGTRGRVTVSASNMTLAAEMGVTTDALLETIKLFPHMVVEDGTNQSHGLTVTWNNWHKYQEDTTMAERQRLSRSKKRGEEKRSIPVVSSPETNTQNRMEGANRPEKKQRAVLADAEFIDALRENPAYKRLDLDLEIGKWHGWFLGSRGRGKQKTRGRLLVWLNRALEDLPLTATPEAVRPYHRPFAAEGDHATR